MNRGFTLIQTMICLLIMSILAQISMGTVIHSFRPPADMVVNSIVMTQYRAIIEDYEQYYDEEDWDIRYNRHGNVNMADTYSYDSVVSIIISLGTGRVYVRR